MFYDLFCIFGVFHSRICLEKLASITGSWILAVFSCWRNLVSKASVALPSHLLVFHQNLNDCASFRILRLNVVFRTSHVHFTFWGKKCISSETVCENCIFLILKHNNFWTVFKRMKRKCLCLFILKEMTMNIILHFLPTVFSF